MALYHKIRECEYLEDDDGSLKKLLSDVEGILIDSDVAEEIVC